MDAFKCSCGAVTVTSGNASCSMPLATFKENYQNLKIDMTVGSCDYCVNHWGVDLCGCGSGKKVGKCKGGFTSCIKKLPSQQLIGV